jgi:hypothetical protein
MQINSLMGLLGGFNAGMAQSMQLNFTGGKK